MRKLVSVLALLCLAASSSVLADPVCTPGTAIRSPITGEMVDCLEGGSTCLYCTDEIIVKGP